MYGKLSSTQLIGIDKLLLADLDLKMGSICGAFKVL